MHLVLVWIARLAGVAGVLLTALAVVTRMSGAYHAGAFEAATLLQAGVAAMVMACLAYLCSIAESPAR